MVILVDFSTFRVDDDFNVVLVDGLNVTGSISSFGFIEKPVLTVATSVAVIFFAGGTKTTAPSWFVVGICSVAVIISSVSATNWNGESLRWIINDKICKMNNKWYIPKPKFSNKFLFFSFYQDSCWKSFLFCGKLIKNIW